MCVEISSNQAKLIKQIITKEIDHKNDNLVFDGKLIDLIELEKQLTGGS